MPPGTSGACLVLAALSLTAPVGAAAQGPVVPHPRDVLGFTPGDDYRLADFTQLGDYFRRLAAASPRVRLEVAGRSTEGRDILVAVISSEANLARLDRYREIARKLALVRGVSDAEARALAQEGKAIVWIDAGLHADETAHAQHTLLLAHERATGETPHRDSPMPWLFNTYSGYENNRDFFMQTQAETRVINRLLYREWLPQIVYNHHQGFYPTRIFVPPFPDPFSPNIGPARAAALPRSAPPAR